jgi:spore coat polysaccharide biosynthesis predicted glycosyltransferase SpsG
MAELMRDADLAIGAAGTTSWERCCLGLPAIVLVLAENQSLIGDQLAEAGAHIVIAANDQEAVVKAITDLVRSSDGRKRMSETAAQITDGLGSARVIAAMDYVTSDEIVHG